tara:strand:+ start:222 stop:566 length:345 start_codon:yes stop_codon:yes gene_type:complete
MARDQRRTLNLIEKKPGLKSRQYCELLEMTMEQWHYDTRVLSDSGAIFRIAGRWFHINRMPEQVIVKVHSEEDPTIAALRAIESKITELELMKTSLELQMTELNEAARLLESLN